jgi:hypothetical protein
MALVYIWTQVDHPTPGFRGPTFPPGRVIFHNNLQKDVIVVTRILQAVAIVLLSLAVASLAVVILTLRF